MSTPTPPSAALVVIGNEILSGRTQDVNIQWIADKMTHLGIRFVEARVVPDVEAMIIATVNELRSKVTYVFTTGGIGPTHDDITAQSIAKAFNVPLLLNPEARQLLLNHYGSEDQLTQPRLKMAMIPEGATLIQNPVSAAPGFKIGNVHVMAGVPRIMQAMLDDVISTLETGAPILSNTVTCGLSESMIAADLEEIQSRYDTVEIGSYPHYRSGVLGLSLVLRSSDNTSLHQATGEVVKMVRDHGGEPRAISIKTDGPGFEQDKF